MYLLVIYFLILVVPIAVMPKSIKAGTLSPYRIVMNSTITITAATVIVFMIATISGQSVFAQIQEMIDLVTKEMARNPMIAETFDMTSMDEVDRAKMFSRIYNSAFEIMPACIMIMGAVISYIEYIIIAKIISKRTIVNKMPKLREFSWPNSAMMGLMGMYLISWILTEMGVFANNMVYMNIDVLFNFAFSIQGVSVVLMFCHMKRVPKAIGVIIAVVMWMSYIGRMVLLMLGMFDLIFGIKRRIRTKNGGK